MSEYDGRQTEAEIEIVIRECAGMKEQQQQLLYRHEALRRRQETQLEAAERIQNQEHQSIGGTEQVRSGGGNVSPRAAAGRLKLSVEG